MLPSSEEEEDFVDRTSAMDALDSAVQIGAANPGHHSLVLASDKGARPSPARNGTLGRIRTTDPISIVIPPVERPWEYQVYEDDTTVAEVLEDIISQHEVKYFVRFKDGHEQTVSLRLDSLSARLAQILES